MSAFWNDFKTDFSEYFTHYIDFNQSTSGRRPFWTIWITLKVIDVIFLITFLFNIITMANVADFGGGGYGMYTDSFFHSFSMTGVISLFAIWITWKIITFIPNLALQCRRLVDMGCGFGLSLALTIISKGIGIVGLATLIMSFFPSKHGQVTDGKPSHEPGEDRPLNDQPDDDDQPLNDRRY